MNIEKVLAVARAEEGVRLKAYWDEIGKVWSIGVGYNPVAHGLDPKACVNLTWSREQAERQLLRDINNAAGVVAMKWPWAVHLDEVRQGVLVLLAFQIGGYGVQGFKAFLAALQAGDYDTAALEMLDSRWHNEQCPARARRMAITMATGRWLKVYNGIAV